MAAVKTNERPGTRARASYVRGSAYKAREVLDQIRGKGCSHALEILAFSERDAARPIGKVLESALSNAQHNDGLDADELYVSACYADEGPTLKRWRPRARGRATRINKRTCHITVIVSRYDPDTLDELRSRTSSSPVRTSEARRRRVARSRAAEAADSLEVVQGSASEPAADAATASDSAAGPGSAGDEASDHYQSSDKSEAGA